MNSLLETITDMGNMSNQLIATDLLILSKNGIQNYAIAITETDSPEIRAVLRKQLDDAIAQHEKIIDYMIKNEFYHPNNLDVQLIVDMNTADKALKVTK